MELIKIQIFFGINKKNRKQSEKTNNKTRKDEWLNDNYPRNFIKNGLL